MGEVRFASHNLESSDLQHRHLPSAALYWQLKGGEDLQTHAHCGMQEDAKDEQDWQVSPNTFPSDVGVSSRRSRKRSTNQRNPFLKHIESSILMKHDDEPVCSWVVWDEKKP